MKSELSVLYYVSRSHLNRCVQLKCDFCGKHWRMLVLMPHIEKNVTMSVLCSSNLKAPKNVFFDKNFPSKKHQNSMRHIK